MPTPEPTTYCTRMCDYSLQGLESQVLEITSRLEAEVNSTAAEVELEVEIIALQHFETLSASVSAHAAELAAPTQRVLADYEALLASLLPDVSDHLKLAAASSDLAAAAAAAAVAAEARPGMRRTVSWLEATADSHANPSAAQGPAAGASPTTAALVVLGALFAGVALAGGAGGRGADGARRRAEYEALL